MRLVNILQRYHIPERMFMVKPARNTVITRRKKPRRGLKKKQLFPLLRDQQSNRYRGEGISVIVPVGGKDRTFHLEKVLQNLHAQNYEPLQVLISEFGVLGKKHFNKKYGPKVRYLYTRGGNAFNKAKAMNKAFMAADNSICALVDADVILPTGYLVAMDKHMQKHEACFLLKRVLHTPVVKHLRHNITPPINYIRSDNFNGASLGIRKDAYYKIGGMCEEFEGYGYEDLEFWDRLRQILKLNEDRIFDVLHLNHGHVRGYDKQWAKNQKIWTNLAGQPPANRAKRFRKILEKYQ